MKENFDEAIAEYGIPSHIRIDHGGENRLISKFMLYARGVNRSSVMTGKSVHNSRIERLWRDVKLKVIL